MAVNPGSLESHQQWTEQFDFGFPVCVDVQTRVAAAYGALKPEGGIQRSVIVVDKQGKVTAAFEGSPETAEILAVIDNGAKG